MVDRLGTHLHLRLVGELDPELSTDLLWAPAPLQQLLDPPAQPRVAPDLALPRAGAALIGADLRRVRAVLPARLGVSPDLTADRRRRPTEPACDRRHALLSSVQVGDQLSLRQAEIPARLHKQPRWRPAIVLQVPPEAGTATHPGLHTCLIRGHAGLSQFPVPTPALIQALSVAWHRNSDSSVLRRPLESAQADQ